MSVARFVVRTPILLYRYTLSGLIGRQCRHLPTCSEYALEAIDRHGAWAGLWMGLARACRCNPWGSSGYDGVPEHPGAACVWWAPWRHGRWRLGAGD